MKALITENYIRATTSEFRAWSKENKGKIVDIDTAHIFNNQYNTKDGFRIYDTHIKEISEDVRTDKNVFFVKHPKGKDKIKECSFEDHRKNERFLSCYSVNGNYYRISRRSSIEFILVGSEVYTVGIGYTPLKNSRLSSNEKEIVRYCVNRILNNKFTPKN